MELELTCDTALLLRVWLFQFLLLLPTKSCALDSCSRRLGAMAEKSKKNKFSVDFKVSAVDLAKWTSVTSAANKLKVTRKMIRQWKKNETELKEAAGTKTTSRCRVASRRKEAVL